MSTQIVVKDYMSKSTLQFSAGTPVTVAIEKLVTFRIGGAPVTDAAGAVIGFVSEHDCISKLLQSSYYCDPDAVVDDVMSRQLESVSPNDNIVDLAGKMLTSRRQVFPVIEHGKLIGVITRSMVLVALKENLADCKSSA